MCLSKGGEEPEEVGEFTGSIREEESVEVEEFTGSIIGEEPEENERFTGSIRPTIVAAQRFSGYDLFRQ